jgi:hypothetical protein
MSDAPIEKVDLALAKLSTDEHIEYQRYLASGKPPLSPGSALKLYELFVQGIECAEIARLNPTLGLGIILRARIDHEWDKRRDEYLGDLYSQANTRLRQVGAESLNFLGLALAAAHKDLGEHMKKYLMSGNPEDLGPFRIMSFKTYQSVVETLVKLTGQDNQKTVKVEGEVHHTGEAATPGAKLTPEQADAMRAALVGKKP